MSASIWDWTLASANGLPLSTDDCFMLLDSDLFNTNEDLLKTIPCAASKLDTNVGEYQVPEDFSSSLYPPSPPERKPSRAQLASDLLQQLDTECKQENIFSNWLEEKVDLPIFDHIQSVPVAFPPQPPTEELLREFESVYGAVELTHLTPPHSPPGPATQLLLTYAHHAQAAQPPPPAHLPSADLERELAVVDELVRHSAQHLAPPAPQSLYVSSSPSLSPRSSPPSSPRSSASSDEDWNHIHSRSKPYSRPSDDRRSRKKEQNKNAATRYRQKKKAEIEILLGEESGLRARHGELGTKCADLQREIRYLKGLMRDLFKAKGLIK